MTSRALSAGLLLVSACASPSGTLPPLPGDGGTPPASDGGTPPASDGGNDGSRPGSCPYTGPPLFNLSSLSPCAPACMGAHCLPAGLVPAAQQSILSACTASGNAPGLCVPDPIIAAGGNFVPKSCTSVAGAEGRCISTCLPDVAAQAAQLPTDVCAAGEKCAPCFNPIGADPTAPTGACSLACDQPAKPPLMLACPWSGPPLIDPATFPDCSPTCGGAHCVPAANVPASEQALLAACAGGFCLPDSIIATGNKWNPSSCTSVAGAEGRCLSTCLPPIAQQDALLPQSTCAAGSKCAPCYNPTATDPTLPTGACSLGCDKPMSPPTLISCPYSGPPVVDPYQLPLCDNACPGAHCLPASAVPPAQQSMLDLCATGFCAPDTMIQSGGQGVPPVCRAFSGQGEGRCLSMCLPQIAQQASQLQQDFCGSNEKCAPCSDPFSGADTGACRTACDIPAEPTYTFPGCCGGSNPAATCIPLPQVPSGQRGALNQAGCPGQFLCVPNEYLPPPQNAGAPIQTCKNLGFISGACVNKCAVNGVPGIFQQVSCPANHVCVDCTLSSLFGSKPPGC